MDLYNAIVEGLKKNIQGGTSVEAYLQSLQKSVKALRIAYRNAPVFVPYENSDIQAAYLVAYLPHYYQLIYKIFIEDAPDIFQGKENIYLTFIGGGPGSEAYGAIKYIVNNCSSAKNIHVTILDINASTWSFSHSIVNDSLVQSITSDNLHIHWQSVYFDLTSSEEIEKVKPIIQKSNLLVIQNCLNEIAGSHLEDLKINLKQLFEDLPGSSYLLMTDLTSGARPTIKSLEKHLVDIFAPKFIKSTLSLSSSKSMISVHHKPSPIIAQYLLTGSNGLIPRKNLSYDYSLMSKFIVEEPIDHSGLGFKAIYRPLDFKKLDANGYIYKKIFIGIDFGTSSTVLSTAQLVDGQIKVRAIPIKQKDHLGSTTSSSLVPTVISLFNDKRLLVGIHAADHKPYLTYGKNTWHSFKQNLGRLDSIVYPESVLAANSDFRISNAIEALTMFFKYLKKQLFEYLKENNLPNEVEYSISVPAGFPSKYKQNLKACLISAGIECEDTPFIEEPNAALINYLFEQNLAFDKDDPQYILVLDLGAGTVDVSILLTENKEEGFTSELLSVVRLGNIGGNLIDESIASLIIEKAGISSFLSHAYRIELVSLCEKLKIKLCKNVITDASVKYKLPSLAVAETTISLSGSPNLQSIGMSSVEVSYNEFNDIMLQYWKGNAIIGGVKNTIDKAIENASLDLFSIDKVIVTGGGGRNPYIKSMVADYFDSSEVFISDNIQEQVSRGVALQSFVLNSFGKNIITPILGHNICLKASNKSILLFDKGITIPTMEIEIELAGLSDKDEQIIACFSEDNEDYQKYFIIPVNLNVSKLIFYVGPDQELECELIGCDFEMKAVETFNELPNKLIKIN